MGLVYARIFFLALSTILVIVSAVLLAVKIDYGGMFLDYWKINAPLFAALSLASIWLFVEIIVFSSGSGGRFQLAGVLFMVLCCFLTVILLCVRFERLKHIPYWGCLTPFIGGIVIAPVLFLIGSYKLKGKGVEYQYVKHN